MVRLPNSPRSVRLGRPRRDRRRDVRDLDVLLPRIDPDEVRLGRPSADDPAFIGAGYVFRTAFFLSIAFGRDWTQLRWMFWGNLAFTATLLLASFWHAEEFNWDPFADARRATSGSSSTSSSRSR